MSNSSVSEINLSENIEIVQEFKEGDTFNDYETLKLLSKIILKLMVLLYILIVPNIMQLKKLDGVK